MTDPDARQGEAWLTEVTERAEKATAGPWSACEMLSQGEPGTGFWNVQPIGEPDDMLAEEDAEFIAHAREDIPRLLAALRTAHEERDAVCRTCEELQQAALTAEDALRTVREERDAARHQCHAEYERGVTVGIEVGHTQGEAERTALRTLIDDVCEEYGDSKSACDACEDCGDLVMCGVHSIISVLRGRTLTTAAVRRSAALSSSTPAQETP